MHPYPEYFAQRHALDALDCAPLMLAGLRGNADRPLLHFDDCAVSAAEATQRIAQFQRWFREQGLMPGDRVAVMLGNGVDHVHLIYALIVSGLVWVPVNTKLRRAGLDYLIGHAKPRRFVFEPDFDTVLSEVEFGETRPVTLPAFSAATAPLQIESPTIEPHAPLCIIYTSGTTGAPKGVIFTHRMMRIASEAVLTVADVRPGDRLLLWEPLCHIGGAQMLMLPFIEAVELHVVPRFSASQFWAQVARARATQLHYLGGVLDILMQLPLEAQPARHTLRVAWGAGVSAAVWHAVESRLRVRLRECYGMTECSSFATVNTNDKPGSIGQALPWLDVELLDENGNPVGVNEPGEIVLSSRVEGAFLPGYLENEAASRAALRNGKLHTGDSARRDADGDLFFIGRKTDSMRVRGENVSAWEIERVFAGHPAVRASAAIGVASSVGEQEILLNVQFKDEPVDWTAMHEWATTQLASFQLPRYYRAVERFELTPSERIRKHLIPRELGDAWDRLSEAAV
ncbi:AMP-binding protein [Paraburkholderia heleia]|uniref:AMP-binding protein n=1 Tax=Paraburkholderia heleia TaxID=634127 RepID=UPI002AB776A4|nr:AMP-binding protein [Paraburkholderia heleia]